MAFEVFEVGQRVRRKRDGMIGTIDKVDWARTANGTRVDIVVFKGVVHAPREFEPIDDEPEPVS